MTKTPKTTLKRSRPKKKRTHLPSLSQVQRDVFQMRMEADSRIPRDVVNAVMASFNAAANKDAETPRVVIDSLTHEEKALIVPFEAGYGAIFSSVGAKGRAALMADSELDSLIEREANDDENAGR